MTASRTRFAMFTVTPLALFLAIGIGLRTMTPPLGAVATAAQTNDGMSISDLDARTLEGEPFPLGDLEGLPVIVEFWATWCGPCLQQRSIVEGILPELEDKVHFVSASVDESPQLVQRHLQRHEAIGHEVMATEEMTQRFNVRSIPMLVFADDQGRVRHVERGVKSADEIRGLVASTSDNRPDAAPEFQRVKRPGSVDVDKEYDITDLAVPLGEIHELLPRDAIPALTDPKRERASDADWMKPDDRVIEIAIGDEALAAPLRILNWHEIVNTTIGGEPIAATYCPLCDSASLISRRVDGPDGEEILEFGVSGALYNSNVIMYDREHMGLWSQLAMEAISGPMAGTPLVHLPVRLITFEEFLENHPDGEVVSIDTGHERQYDADPYRVFFDTDRILVPVSHIGDALPLKTLGLGVIANDTTWFVPTDAAGDGLTLKTDLGDVVLRTSDAGVVVQSSPKGVRSVQTFYYAWSAFHPDTRIVSND
ncbi:MAG: DUF3179 domain-containing protein [Phycisphaeraceae bacterium]|nr:MAG: DUF3179 domain-containing protein [Phycisphaeraceae bacterium]